MDDPRESIITSISLDKTRVILSPHLTFLCGGEVDVTQTNNHSVRNMIMNKTPQYESENIKFVLAENYKDWKEGYSSLSDFENDIAYLSSKIVVIPESAGSLAELGLFFGNEVIRKKMTVILNTQHHESDSFIKHGILNPLEEVLQDAVLPYEINYEDIENVLAAEVDEALQDVIQACENLDKTTVFSIKNRGHILLLIYQILDLLHALTVTEITNYLRLLTISYDKKMMQSAIYILQKFDLIGCRKRGRTYFYFANPSATERLSIKHVEPSVNFDYTARKLDVFGFYEEQAKKDRNFRKRNTVIKSLREELI